MHKQKYKKMKPLNKGVESSGLRGGKMKQEQNNTLTIPASLDGTKHHKESSTANTLLIHKDI